MGNCGERFGHLFITSSSSHFFNKPISSKIFLHFNYHPIFTCFFFKLCYKKCFCPILYFDCNYILHCNVTIAATLRNRIENELMRCILQILLVIEFYCRDTTELPYLAIDRSYDFNYQETRRLSEEREVLPGDTLQVICDYKSKGVRQNMTVVIVIVITFYSPSCLGQETARDLSVFESSCHLPTCLPHTTEASHCPFNCWTSKQESCEYQFL